MLRQIAECLGVALSAIGGALEDMAGPDKLAGLLHEREAYKAENERLRRELSTYANNIEYLEDDLGSARLERDLAKQALQQCEALRDAFAARNASLTQSYQSLEDRAVECQCELRKTQQELEALRQKLRDAPEHWALKRLDGGGVFCATSNKESADGLVSSYAQMRVARCIEWEES